MNFTQTLLEQLNVSETLEKDIPFESNDIRLMMGIQSSKDNELSVQSSIQERITLSGEELKKLRVISHVYEVSINSIIHFGWHKLIQLYTKDSETIVGQRFGCAEHEGNLPDCEQNVEQVLPMVVNWNKGNRCSSILLKIDSELKYQQNIENTVRTGLQSAYFHLFDSQIVYRSKLCKNFEFTEAAEAGLILSHDRTVDDKQINDKNNNRASFSGAVSETQTDTETETDTETKNKRETIKPENTSNA